MIFNFQHDLNAIVRASAAPVRRVGVTTGCFDLLHPLHVLYLNRCRVMCDMLIVGVDADMLYHRFKKRMPVQHEQERTFMVDSLKAVDATYVMGNLEQLETLLMALSMEEGKLQEGIKPYLFRNLPKPYGVDIVGQKYAEIVIVPDVDLTTSSTQLKARIRKRKRSSAS